jgi:hypothetical protein
MAKWPVVDVDHFPLAARRDAVGEVRGLRKGNVMPIVTCPKCDCRYDPGIDEAAEDLAELDDVSLKIVCPRCGQWLRWPELQAIRPPKAPQALLDEMSGQSRPVSGGPGGSKQPRSRRKEDETLDDESIVMGHGAVASNPGRLRVQTFRWIRHKPLWPLLWAGLLAGSLLLPIAIHWSLWFLVVTLLGCNILYWLVVRGVFWSGDANASIVVDVDPLLVAVATDLTKGRGSYPVVKIIEVALDDIDGNEPEVGDRLATVASYSPSGDSREHWSDFDPLPVQYATDDEDEIAELMESFGEENWVGLKMLLREVPRPYEPGLYKIGGDWEQKKKKRPRRKPRDERG